LQQIGLPLAQQIVSAHHERPQLQRTPDQADSLQGRLQRPPEQARRPEPEEGVAPGRQGVPPAEAKRAEGHLALQPPILGGLEAPVA